MADPVIAQRGPFGMDLEPGKYWWCACGRSSNQPFCDGSHKDTGFSPLEVTVEARKKVWLCGCKHSKTAPFCDGSHNKID